jgi:hypothetical protein
MSYTNFAEEVYCKLRDGEIDGKKVVFEIETLSDLAITLTELAKKFDDNKVLDDNDAEFHVSKVIVENGKVYLDFED